MASTCVLTKLEKLPGGGIEAVFGDGTGLSWPSEAEFLQAMADLDNNADLVKLIACAQHYSRDRDLKTKDILADKSVTMDVLELNPIQIR